jgi:predicted SAM-dependent methyltransferase
MSHTAKEALKTIVGMARRPLAKRRLEGIVAGQQNVKIEFGAFSSSRVGWVCTDISWRARCYLDATRPWPFYDGQASHVYSDNVIEHIRMDGNRALFREARRVLQPGGRIRLVTPDVGRLVDLYQARSEDSRSHLDNARMEGYKAYHYVDLLRIVFQDCGHHLGYLWDFESLGSELETAGFVDVVRYENQGQSEDPVFTGLEGRTDPAGMSPIGLIVEASTPS